MSGRAQAVSALFDARSIAVIGASPTPGRFSHTPLRNLRRYGFTGAVFPINPRGGEVEGWQCLTSTDDLPYPPDHAVIAVRAENAPAAVRDCIARGVRAFTVLASGFGETGTAAGLALDAALADSHAGHDVALVGPNTLGIANFNTCTVPFASTILPAQLGSGSIALVSQSGGVGFTILGRAWHAGIGVGQLVGVGNEAVLTVADYIDCFLERPDVSAICCYFESIRHPSRFLAVALRAAEAGKPIVVLRAGRSEVGQRAAAAHTGALAGTDAVTAAVLRQHGVIEVESIEALVTTGALHARYGAAKGARVGIYAQGGGAAVIMSDKFSRAGIDLPQPAEATRRKLQAMLPDTTPGNPLDSGGQFLGGGEDALYDALTLFAADESFDVIAHSLLSLTGGREHTYADAVARTVAAVAKPQLVLQYCAGDMSAYSRAMFRERGVIALDQPDAAVGGLAAWLSYPGLIEQAKRRGETPQPATDPRLRDEIAADLAERRRRGETAVLEFDAKQCLARYGVPVTQEAIVHDRDRAVAAAGAIGFPVVLKLLSRDLTHRAGTGTIRLGLGDGAAVARAYDEIEANARRLDVRFDGMLVAEQVKGDLELIAGVQADPLFGPVIVLGMGGIWVELLKDAGFRLPPIGVADVAEMIAELRTAPLLGGYRGGPVVSPERLAGILQPLAAFAQDMREHVEAIDLNPLIVAQNGTITVVDALIILKPAEGVSE